MDMQQLFDTISEVSRAERSNYHLTLGDLVKGLEVVPGDFIVGYQGGGHPGEPMSYRGYYSDLSFEDGQELSASSLLAIAQSCLGRAFEGYKGGQFTMNEDTPLWRSEYGCSSNEAIVGMFSDDGLVTLITKAID